MNRTYRTLSTMLGGLLTVALAIASPSAWADDDDDMEIEFDEHEIFFELNYTDEDLGIHALIDGEAWKRLIIKRDDNDRKLLDIRVRSKLRQQGLTELFFESAEPAFEELSPAEFFARFPEGEYDIEGRTLEGDELESETEITHLVPAPAEPALETGGGDFDAERDIAAITVNRWPHGYAYEYNDYSDSAEFGPDNGPHIAGRAQLGRISIANSDSNAFAYVDGAIDAADRAINEQLAGS